MNDNELHQLLCQTFHINYLQEMDIILKMKTRKERKINGPLVLFVILFGRSASNVLTTSTGKNMNNDPTDRQKKAIPVLAIAQGMAALSSMLIKSINALVDAKRASSFNNAIKMLNANVEITHNRLVTLENRTSMMAKANMPALQDLKMKINNTNQQLASQYRMMNSGYLTHHILHPQVLSRYLEAIEDDLEEMAPDHDPVFTNVYQYYGNLLASFTNTNDDLLLQLPILIKLKVQVPMSLFSIKMAPVPLDAGTYIGDKREYTQIIPETEYIALTDNNYVPLTQVQITLCAKIGYMCYCEYAHLLKKHTEHTCMSAIYYDQQSKVKAKQCKMIVTFDTTLESRILDASNMLIYLTYKNLGQLLVKMF